MSQEETVPSKTPDGVAELAHRTRGLSQRHRTVLLLVDGRRPTSQVSLQFEHPLTGPVSAVLRLRHFGVPHDVDLGARLSVQDHTLRVPARLFCQLVPTFRSEPRVPHRGRS